MGLIRGSGQNPEYEPLDESDCAALVAAYRAKTRTKFPEPWPRATDITLDFLLYRVAAATENIYETMPDGTRNDVVHRVSTDLTLAVVEEGADGSEVATLLQQPHFPEVLSATVDFVIGEGITTDVVELGGTLHERPGESTAQAPLHTPAPNPAAQVYVDEVMHALDNMGPYTRWAISKPRLVRYFILPNRTSLYGYLFTRVLPVAILVSLCIEGFKALA